MKGFTALSLGLVCCADYSYGESQNFSSIQTEARVRLDARHRQTTVDNSGQSSSSEYSGIEIQSMEFIAKGKITTKPHMHSI